MNVLLQCNLVDNFTKTKILNNSALNFTSTYICLNSQALTLISNIWILFFTKKVAFSPLCKIFRLQRYVNPFTTYR